LVSTFVFPFPFVFSLRCCAVPQLQDPAATGVWNRLIHTYTYKYTPCNSIPSHPIPPFFSVSFRVSRLCFVFSFRVCVPCFRSLSPPSPARFQYPVSSIQYPKTHCLSFQYSKSPSILVPSVGVGVGVPSLPLSRTKKKGSSFQFFISCLPFPVTFGLSSDLMYRSSYLVSRSLVPRNVPYYRIMCTGIRPESAGNDDNNKQAVSKGPSLSLPVLAVSE
jgi:hypothetical protein